MFKCVVVGGTFDRFHRGHRTFLETAFGVGETIAIAVTSDEFLEKQWKTRSNWIQKYAVRAGVVKEFLERRDMVVRAHVFKIGDGVGDAHVNAEYDAIVVTEETKVAALKINALRERGGLQKLVVVEVPLVLAEDRQPISSTRIRAGIIDAEGKLLKPTGTRIGNETRRNLAELLETQGSAYGYDLYKLYRKSYGPISLRLVYYHLAKGCAEGIFQVKEVRHTEGGYSWGKHAERVYYELGPAAVATRANKQKAKE